MTDQLDARRARIQRLAAKRPPAPARAPAIAVTVTHAPSPDARELLIELLLELLDEQARSGGG
ncbi:MAG TPA: hypothetical protein VN253_07285 [Kofleriaceae bacterium]|nr:hypothetical protein [Kofleriaceae bacterium]